MNIERGWKIPEKHQTAHYVASELGELANVLSSGRWSRKAVRSVALSRTIMEEIGIAQAFRGEEIEPMSTEIELSFRASKRRLETESVDHFEMSSETSVNIGSTDMSDEILDEIFEDSADDFHDLDEESDIVNFERESLDELDIRKIQKVAYEVSHDGRIQDYTISVTHTFDDTEVHTTDYTESLERPYFVPVYLNDGASFENKPVAVPILSEQAISDEMKRLDESFTLFLQEDELRPLLELNGQPVQDHYKRILAMKALLLSGFEKHR